MDEMDYPMNEMDYPTDEEIQQMYEWYKERGYTDE